LPSIFHIFITPANLQLEQQLNRNVTLALLGVYVLNLLLMLKTDCTCCYFYPTVLRR
jgi:hypothetical protein